MDDDVSDITRPHIEPDPTRHSRVDEKRAKANELVQKYTESVGLGVLRPVNEVNRFLTVTVHDIRRMSAEECGEAAVILNQEATYVQLQCNQIQADVNWCEQYVNFLVANTVMSCGSQYTPFEVRKTIAIKNDDVAMKVQAAIVNARLRLDALSYMPNQLRATASSFADLQQTKRTQKM